MAVIAFPQPATSQRTVEKYAVLCAKGFLTRAQAVHTMMQGELDPLDGSIRARLVHMLANQSFMVQTARMNARAEVYAAVQRAAKRRECRAVLLAVAASSDPRRLLRDDERERVVHEVTEKLLNEWGVRK